MDALAPPGDAAALRADISRPSLPLGVPVSGLPDESNRSSRAPAPRPVLVTHFKGAGAETVTVADPTSMAREFAPYAALSLNIHRAPSAGGTASPEPAARLTRRPLPLPPGWRRNPNLGSSPVDCAGGLHYEVWELMAHAAGETRIAPIEVCIVFRGPLWWRVEDWRMNLRRRHCRGILDALRSRLRLNHWRVFGMDAFDRVTGESKRIFEYYQRHHPYHNIAFTSTGHALGGGLAQCLLYADPARIKRAYTFNPSLVTGFRGQPAATRYQAYCDCPGSPPMPRIVRVYAQGTLLERVRRVLGYFLPPGPHVHVVRFDVGKRWNSFAQHAMPPLAGGIMRLTGWQPSHADRRRRRPEQSSTGAW